MGNVGNKSREEWPPELSPLTVAKLETLRRWVPLMREILDCVDHYLQQPDEVRLPAITSRILRILELSHRAMESVLSPAPDAPPTKPDPR